MSYVNLPPIPKNTSLQDLYKMLEDERSELKTTKYPNIIKDNIKIIEDEIAKRENTH